MASPLFDTPDVCPMLGIHHVTSAASAAFATAKSPRASAAKNVSTICVLSSTSIGHSPRLWRGAALKSQQLCSAERNGRRYIPAATLSQQPTLCNTGRKSCIVHCETKALSHLTEGSQDITKGLRIPSVSRLSLLFGSAPVSGELRPAPASDVTHTLAARRPDRRTYSSRNPAS